MRVWTVDNVSSWLREISVTEDTVAKFKEENVHGYALLHMDKSALESMKVKVGDRITIVGMRDEYLQAASSAAPTESGQNFPSNQEHDKTSGMLSDGASEYLHSLSPTEGPSSVPVYPTAAAEKEQSQPSPESNDFELNLKEDVPSVSRLPTQTLRKFDTDVDIRCKYKKGAKLPCLESRPGGNLLLPVHRFVHLDLTDEHNFLEFAKECVGFVCACMNDRANGTIHFGIGSAECSPFPSAGEVIGTAIIKTFESYDQFVTTALKKCFSEDQLEAVMHCVRPVKFIEVVSQEPVSLYVLEIDVIAGYRWCEERAFFVKLPKGKNCYDDMMVYRIVDGVPRALQPKELDSFMETKSKLASDRQCQEQRAKSGQNQSKTRNDQLNKKFLHLFCDGEENFYGDHYRILVINAADKHMDEKWMEDNLKFLCELEWKAIFDFDYDGKICQFFQNQEEVIKITMSDEFNSLSDFNCHEPDHLRSLFEDLKSSVHPSWVFANGYIGNSSEARLAPAQWKRKKADGFKKAVRFFSSEIPSGRATVVFCLFSNDTDVILEAAEEFLACFPERWLCVTESESVGNPWFEELIRRHCIEPNEERMVIGLPWNHIDQTFARIHAPKQRVVCRLSTSTGTMVELNTSVMNQLPDIEVLGCNECDAESELMDQAHRDDKQKDEEFKFYRGESPSWWNFWYPNQVCEREIHSELKKCVEDALSSTCEDDIIDRVYVYHQPGAGGTTSAKHVLWDLRKQYRVGIVRNITDHHTGEQIKQLGEQILKLYQYQDPHPKPIVLLMDNPDEETGYLLLRELEEISKKMKRHGDDDQNHVVCVFLVCMRQTRISVSKHMNKHDPKHICLRHELSEREKNWFRDKAKTLQTRFDAKDKRTVDPRLLISFNILKENFDEKFICRMVKDFVADIQDIRERKLLKYISLINAFDLDCRPLPSSAFDGIMIDMPWTPGQRMGKNAKLNRWEVKLSPAIRILMNESSKPAMGYIHSLRITNPLLSLKILSELQRSDSSAEPVSSIALELFHCKDMFEVSSITRDKLLDVIKDVLKKRRHLPNGLPEHEFAPLILHIMDTESMDKAAQVLKEGYDLTRDAFVAQQIARLFIKAQDWDCAFQYAEIATEMVHDNSYLWDTYGRIYEKKLATELDKEEDDDKQFSTQEFIRIADFGLAGLEIFRKVQTLNEREKLPHNADYFGELRMIITILDCLMRIKAFDSVEDMREFLVTERYVPEHLLVLSNVNGLNYVQELKNLKENVDKVLNHIEDEKLQLRDDMKLPRVALDNLVTLKKKLNKYFGENEDLPPNDLTESEQCHYRRRRIFTLASNNMKSIFDLRWQKKDRDTLKGIREIIGKNVSSDYVKANDYLILISVNLALTSVDPEFCTDVDFALMVDWSSKLYETRETMNTIYLEPYLFFALFHWPRDSTERGATKKTEIALRQWKDAYNKKYPRQCHEDKPYHIRKKDATLFFLANGNGMESIYTMFEDHSTMRANETRGSTFWRQPDTIRKLQRFQGTLLSGGKEVQVQTSKLTIPTSFPIRDRSMWMKKNYFVIGFSFVGPKAFDVTLQDPAETITR